MRNCFELIPQDARSIVVVSATSQTTNQLEKLHQLLEANDLMVKDQIQLIIKKHQSIALDLNLNWQQSEPLKKWEEKIRSLEQTNKKFTLSEIYLFGEWISSLLFSLGLNQSNQWLWAPTFMKTDSFSNPIQSEITQLINQTISLYSSQCFVTQGFIAQDLTGKPTHLGREGSDFSATLIGEALKASEVQIWTDVPGVLFCDPRQYPQAKVIHSLSYEAAEILANKGAKVLHPSTLGPLKNSKIQLKVLSTKDPQRPGTTIGVGNLRPIEGVAIQRIRRNNGLDYNDAPEDSPIQIQINIIGDNLPNHHLLKSRILEKLDGLGPYKAQDSLHSWGLLIDTPDQDKLANWVKALQDIASEVNST